MNLSKTEPRTYKLRKYRTLNPNHKLGEVSTTKFFESLWPNSPILMQLFLNR